ncbi:MAG: NAD(P)-dependent glycerol-3-phosphate dehydrogenase [Candidatus Saganbacteria bacterium]|nr:NAD(P)-dependent glycerol-3-phosphate dehydrogenase [Candidatus Saganbacteria bacterium]
MKYIAVLGAGAWGTTLANMLAKNGLSVKIWTFEKGTADDINNNNENKIFLPGVKLNKNISASDDLEDVLIKDGYVICAIPTKYLRNVLIAAAEQRIVPKNMKFLSAAKGIEKKTLDRPSQIIEKELGIKVVAVISGPNLSKEIATGLPAASVVASRDKKLSAYFQQVLSSPSFRVYTSNDLIGVELGGALKNVIAIAAGICDGLSLGNNAKSALIIRGMAEITRLGIAAGAKKETFSGLSGIGDLITTCQSDLSRNHHVGVEIAKGKKLNEILSLMSGVPEGVETVISSIELAKRLKIEMPIASEVKNVLFEGKDPKQAILDLMNRQLKDED